MYWFSSRIMQGAHLKSFGVRTAHGKQISSLERRHSNRRLPVGDNDADFTERKKQGSPKRNCSGPGMISPSCEGRRSHLDRANQASARSQSLCDKSDLSGTDTVVMRSDGAKKIGSRKSSCAGGSRQLKKVFLFKV